MPFRSLFFVKSILYVFFLDFFPFLDEGASGKMSGYGITMKSGVMHRVLQLCDSVGAVEQTITLKLTLQKTDLLLLEDPSMKDSFAVVAQTYAVLNLSDPRGELNVNLEMQVRVESFFFLFLRLLLASIVRLL